MSQSLRIGIDFDNTIITYDEVFCAAAKSSGLLGSEFVGSKRAVRDAIRRLPGGETAWQRLQGQVYGKEISRARMIAGVESFLRRCRIEGCDVAIVSHKTEYGHFDRGRVNLRKAALGWMSAQRLFEGDSALTADNIYFESTRAGKLERIVSLSLTHFIDDLEEVLIDPAFPPHIKRILFADAELQPAARYVTCPTWRAIEEKVFERA